MNEVSKSRSIEPLGMNRTYLFLLVIGLFIVAWHRNRGGPAAAPASTAAPAPGHKPAVAAPTNSTTEHSLVSVEQPIHK